jgi:hypothetical protein
LAILGYQGSNSSINAVGTFSVTIVDNCPSTTVTYPSSGYSFTYGLATGSIIDALTTFTESLGYCGAFAYAFT